MDKFMECGVRVYQFDEYSYFASKWDYEKTKEWYLKNISDGSSNVEIEEDKSLCNLDENTMWWEKEVSDNEVITEQLKNIDGTFYEKITFKEAIKRNGLDFEEPYELCCTEW